MHSVLLNNAFSHAALIMIYMHNIVVKFIAVEPPTLLMHDFSHQVYTHACLWYNIENNALAR